MGKLSIIIPVYYNELNLQPLYQDLKEKVLPFVDYEIIMVDDGSKDGSWKQIKAHQALDPNIIAIRLSRNFGSHAAILAGLNACTGDCATVKAADLQEPSEMLLQMVASWQAGNKVVLGVRSDREDGFFQKFFASGYYWLVRKFALPNMPKGGFDCFLIDRKVIEVLKLLDEKNSAITLQILWAGFQTEAVYYVRQKRTIGKSRWTLSKKFKLIVDSLISFSFVPIRFVSSVGLIFFVCSLLWGAFLVGGRLFGGITVDGWTTLMVMLLLSSGMIMLTLGVLGEYIWRTMDASRDRPVFIIDKSVSNTPKNTKDTEI